MNRQDHIDLFLHERRFIAAGFARIAGVDEAGRGPLAGPVVAAAVILPVDWLNSGLPNPLDGLTDSKQLTAPQRSRFFDFLIHCDELRSSVKVVGSAIIDSINILQATHRAMNEALASLDPPPAHVLVDGLRVPSLRFDHTPLVQGDSRSYSIAAASVLAKVTRDRLLDDFDRQYPGYGFAEHRGYGTPRHFEALARLGPCPIHRRSFAPLKPVQQQLF